VTWTLGEMMGSPASSALIAELSPAALRGRYQGVNSLSWSGGSALGPILGGLVQQHLGSTVLWLACAGIGIAVAAGQLVSGPARERRAAALRRTVAPPGPRTPLAPPPADGETRHDEDTTPPAIAAGNVRIAAGE
jgi:MFS family permease